MYGRQVRDGPDIDPEPETCPGRVVQALVSYGKNQTVLNELHPRLVPLIAKARTAG